MRNKFDEMLDALNIELIKMGALCEEEGVENVPDFCIKEAGVACTQRGRQQGPAGRS